MDPEQLIAEILSTGTTAMVAGTDHTIEWMSDSARMLLGEVTDEVDLVGHDWFGLTTADARPIDDRAFSQALRSGTSDWYVRSWRMSGATGDEVLEVETLIVKRNATPFRWLALLRVPSADTAGTSLSGNVRARAAATMQLARRLTGCSTHDQVLQVIDRLAAPALAVDTVSLTFVDDGGWTHPDPALGSDHFADLDDHIDVDSAVGAAWKLARTVIVSEVDALAERYPTTIARMATAPLVSYAAVPLFDPDGQVFAVLHCGWRRRAWIDVPHLEGLSELIGNAILAVRTSERQRQIAGALQEIMLPHHPGDIADCTVATRYQPIEALVGGDFYDVVERGDHVWFIVGDVTGHGLEAARTMGKVRFFLRAILRDCQGPSQLLRAVSQVLVDERRDELATCAVALWDRAAGTLQVATAANIVPLIADSRGVRYVQVDPLPPLGIVRAELPEHPEALIPVTSAAQLLMFTDGLVERRDDRIDESLEVLRATIEDSAWTAHQVVAQLLEPLLSTATDDVAVLCADLRPRRERVEIAGFDPM